ncbi:3-hexulose-6-phosphate isomerase [Paenibacillus faecis]|uniref:6-phospho-3-hexuloisomerase n=1 Tax=Paenibacillus faecis TaxID=862114 RepID=UPI001B250B00|nr:6-phospho-3-hexuloisomerase [Paenibacillus faecis]GIO86110.1 3-hexulose-6-phosphate isomerase [Paenibacillus faecis]
MSTIVYASSIVEELRRAVDKISVNEAEHLVNLILKAEKVFVAGAGRSGLMGRAFAMRLMHLGIQAYVVGETVTPGIGSGDLLIIGSGSGETQSLIGMANKAKHIGATVALVTIHPNSTLGRLSVTVQLPGSAKDSEDRESTASIQPMASLFEQMLIILFDAVILRLMDQMGQNARQMFDRHANLE